MLYYSQSTGQFERGIDISRDVLFAGCYAGIGAAKNNPSAQNLKNAGPLPQGVYTLGHLQSMAHLGPCIQLQPAPSNSMFGRSGFWIHLDNPAHVGNSSDGCIVCQNEPGTPGIQKLETIDRLRSEGELQLTVTP